MRISRSARTEGVGLKSYLSSGTISAIPSRSPRVLSQVALVGARKLVGGKGWASAGPTVRSVSAAVTTLQPRQLFLIVPPDRVRRCGVRRRLPSLHHSTIAALLPPDGMARGAGGRRIPGG